MMSFYSNCCSASQRTEELAEAAKVWSEPVTRDNSIQLTDEKIETIKSLMSGVVLGNVPGEPKTFSINELILCLWF